MHAITTLSSTPHTNASPSKTSSSTRSLSTTWCDRLAARCDSQVDRTPELQPLLRDILLFTAPRAAAVEPDSDAHLWLQTLATLCARAWLTESPRDVLVHLARELRAHQWRE